MCMPKTVKFYSVFPQNECEKLYVSVIKNCLKLDALTDCMLHVFDIYTCKEKRNPQHVRDLSCVSFQIHMSWHVVKVWSGYTTCVMCHLYRCRHLMNDLKILMPHSRAGRVHVISQV